MTSQSQLRIDAVVALITAALPVAIVVYDQPKPDDLPTDGFINVLNPVATLTGVGLSPLTYNYDEDYAIEVVPGPDQALDDLLIPIGAAVEANRGLFGLADFLQVTVAQRESAEADGTDALAWASLSIIATFATRSPLG